MKKSTSRVYALTNSLQSVLRRHNKYSTQAIGIKINCTAMVLPGVVIHGITT